MGTIGVHEFMSLDGVFETPSWTAEFGFDPAMGETIGAITGAADALLLGRETFEMFAPAWSTRSADDDPGVPFFNDSTKYVVSSTLSEPERQWANSTAIGGYDADRIRQLKDDHRGLYVSGSGTLVRGLLADGLVDELHLFVFPVVLGGGKRLFPDGSSHTTLKLQESATYENGVVHLSYGSA